MSLDDVSRVTGISKPYLSLIETNKTKSPPSDEKLRKLEGVLKFEAGTLTTRAHLARTPADVRAVLRELLPVSAEGAAERGLRIDAAYWSGALAALVDERAGNVEPVALTRVPVVNKVSAGYPADFTDLGYPARVADAYVPAPVPPAATAAGGGSSVGGEEADGRTFAARVHGDSMRPVYSAGDIVVFAASPEPGSGDDCFVRLDDGQTTFKRVYFEKTEAGEDVVRLVPLNEKYKPRTLPAERVAGVYRAVWVVRAVERLPTRDSEGAKGSDEVVMGRGG